MSEHYGCVVLSDQHVTVELRCKTFERDLSDVAYDDLPDCRKNRDEDGREIPGPALTYCNPLEWITNEDVIECLEMGESFTPRSQSFDVDVSWNGDGYRWKPSVVTP